MARKYNHIIRILESWLADLEDPEKEFSDAERWQVIRALAQCQIDCSLEPLHALPLVLRRGLQVATMGEQLMAVMDRAAAYKQRGQALQARRAPAIPQALPSDRVKAAEREQQQQARAAAEASQAAALKADLERWGCKTPLEVYQAKLRAAAAGDMACRAEIGPVWRENALRAGYPINETESPAEGQETPKNTPYV